MDGFVYYTFTALTAFLVTLVLLGVFEPLARWLARLPLWAELLIGLSLPFLGALLMLVGFSFFPDHQEPQQTPTAAGSDSWLRSLAAVRSSTAREGGRPRISRSSPTLRRPSLRG